jgi:hypothetical protein
VLGAIAILAIGCDVTFLLPASPARPQTAPGFVDTVVAATAGAAQTQTAESLSPTPTPTFTPPPSNTPSLTPTLTPTFRFVLGASTTPVRTATAVGAATSTGSASDGGDGCILLSQTPRDGAHFDPRRSFRVAWEVENTGSSAWDADRVDFVFSSGAEMHKKQRYDLPSDIRVGDSVTLEVSMAAPNPDGTYFTVWSLRRGSNEFCHVNLTIEVP